MTFDALTQTAEATVTARPAAVAQRTARVAEPVSFDVVQSRAGFDALEADWNALFERAGRSEQMFQQFNWLWHWAKHYVEPTDQFAIVTGRRAGRLILIWPLMLSRPLKLRELTWMGDPVSQYGDVVLDDVSDATEVLSASWSYLLKTLRPDVIRLPKVRSDAVIAPLTAKIGFAVTGEEEAPYATLSKCKTYAVLEERMAPKHRKNRRRQLRRLEERGPLVIDTLTQGAEARDLVTAAMTLKRAWLNDKGLVSRAFADRRVDAFFADAVDTPSKPTGVMLSRLSSAGETADVNVSITCKGRRAVHILAYALKFDKAGVGNHHLATAIEQAFADGVATYDFLAPRHEYKMEWADGTVVVGDHTYAVTLAGRAYRDVYVATLREGAKKLVKRLPRALTRHLAGAHRTTTSII